MTGNAELTNIARDGVMLVGGALNRNGGWRRMANTWTDYWPAP